MDNNEPLENQFKEIGKSSNIMSFGIFIIMGIIFIIGVSIAVVSFIIKLF